MTEPIDLDALDDLVFRWPTYTAPQREDLRAALAELRAARKVVEAAQITLASMTGQYGFPFTLEQFKTWDGPAMLQRALTELEALK